MKDWGKRIEGKIAAHDRFQFEIKLGYTLNPSVPKNAYNVDLFLFVPKSLGINAGTYDKRAFYNNLQGYIRFKTPTFSFSELTDPGNNLSPLTRIRLLIETNPDRQKLIAELKLLACTTRVATRNMITGLRKKVRKNELEGFVEILKANLDGLTKALNEFRSLVPALNAPTIHENVRAAYRHVDEYLGISIDALLNSLHNTVISSPDVPQELAEEVGSLVKPVIISEYDHRKKHSYALYDFNSENELFLYRKGILKKIITSILFLRTHTEEAMVIARDVAFAVAAGIAMVLATGVTIWASLKYGTTSMPFILAIVIGYMAKDRIKDWCKLLFSSKMTRWFSDYNTDILDPANDKKIGICKQAFSFISEKKVPADILRYRRHNTPSDFWLQEDVIKYEKDIILNPRPVLKAHMRLRDITDIIRFNIRHFLERMDEPYEIRRAIDPASGNVAEFKCARVYHINMVLRLEDDIRRIRLVMNQNGIKRIEEVV